MDLLTASVALPTEGGGEQMAVLLVPRTLAGLTVHPLLVLSGFLAIFVLLTCVPAVARTDQPATVCESPNASARRSATW